MESDWYGYSDFPPIIFQNSDDSFPCSISVIEAPCNNLFCKANSLSSLGEYFPNHTKNLDSEPPRTKVWFGFNDAGLHCINN